MSDSRDRDDITFKIGIGNQSAICGGVVPMKVVDPKDEPVERKSPMPGRETRPAARTQDS